MDSDKPHRTGTTSSTSSSELFICFTSRLSSSSSSMKISSKSILSPGRARDPPISLSTSLSRRLRTNGSMKGGQASPMFPTGGKKRGCAFENPEPSSPKVTCIGQVRVKTKKKGKKMRTLSRRQSGEVSFRKLEQSASQSHASAYQQTSASSNQECVQHRNQRWVHLPLTICEALRAFGAEFSCLFPCRPSCFSSTSEREKQEKAAAAAAGSSEGRGGQQSSCGAVFARWLVALQDGEGEKGREIELMVGGDEERNDLTEIPVRNSRRHVFDEIEITDEMCHVKDEVEEEDEARVSICIPPKNALLLMRCRSDPMKMAALTNRFWESPAPKDDEEEDGEEIEYAKREQEPAEHLDECEVKYEVEMVEKDEQVLPEQRLSIEVHEEQENPETATETNLEMRVQQEDEEINEEVLEESEQEKHGETEVNQTVEEENALAEPSFEALVDQENEEEDPIEEKEGENRGSYHSDKEDGEAEEEALGFEAALELGMEKVTEATALEDKEEEIVTHERSDPEDETHEEEEEEEEGEGVGRKSEERERSVLPECLLLMMCEPKLSMEVSKETWVCSTDFIRWQPVKQQVKPKDGQDDSNKKRVTADSDSNRNPIPPRPPVHDQPLQQPARSSCSFPAPAGGVSMATMIEQKLVNAGGYEPFVLTRCKSEPMRTAAAKLAPDTCFWKNRKLEPHRRSNFGVGAAGVGF